MKFWDKYKDIVFLILFFGACIGSAILKENGICLDAIAGKGCWDSYYEGL